MRKFIFSLIFITLMLSCDVVKADYNGSGSGSIAGVGTCSPTFIYPCTWDNNHFSALQIELIYYNGSSWNKVSGSRTVYFVNNRKYASIIENMNNTVIFQANINTCGENAGPYGSCQYNDDWLRNYYADGPNAKEHTLSLLSTMGVNPASLNLPHDPEINFNSKGYRLVLEPIWQFSMPGSGNLQLMTIKEVFRKYGGTSNPAQWASESILLTTDLDDIGIYAHGKNATSNASTIADPRQGYGFNIINPPKEIFKTCYKFGVSGKNPVCRTEDEYANINNTGYFEEQFTETDCDSSEKVEDAELEGRLVKTINSHCKIYCTERVDLSLPGSILPAISKGSYFIWPTLGKSVNDKHNLKITGTRTCTKKLLPDAEDYEISQCNAYSMSVNDLYKNFEASMKIKYYDKEYKFSGKKLEVNSSTSRVESGSSSNQKKLIREVTLKLPSDLYRYYDTNSKKYLNDKNESSSTVISFGQGVLPVSLTETVMGKKDIELYDFKLGSNNVFGSKANQQTYKCVYEVTDDDPSECICPPGTDNSGMDLWCKIANNGGENCPTAIEKYCNDTTLDPSDLICEDKPKYCPPPYQYVSVESCVNAGNSYQSCVNKYCTGNPPKYECPRNDPNGGTEWMDITNCVEELISKGHSQSSAIKVCQDVVCPATERSGLNIIYRTISLRNPFPSKQLNANIVGFNLDVNGRYPGANWNSRELVKAKILNNRGSSDPNKIYNNRKPLYRIVLSPKNIQAIKNYNRSRIAYGGYQDFNLKCYGKNANGEYDGSECLSEFLKDLSGSYGVDKSGSACYQKRGEDFENCRK